VGRITGKIAKPDINDKGNMKTLNGQEIKAIADFRYCLAYVIELSRGPFINYLHNKDKAWDELKQSLQECMNLGLDVSDLK
jgi:hypothetical protein